MNLELEGEKDLCEELRELSAEAAAGVKAPQWEKPWYVHQSGRDESGYPRGCEQGKNGARRNWSSR